MSKKFSIILSTTYLPPIEYLFWIQKADSVLIEGEENYIRQTYRNRCEIYSANGKLSLTIPVVNANGNHTRIKDVRIDHSQKWKQNHWRAIVSAYNQSPYFLYYRNEIEPHYLKNYNYLFEFNQSLLQVLFQIVGLNKSYSLTTEYVKNVDEQYLDLRYSISPKFKSKIDFKFYRQVFTEKFGFQPNLSIVDLIFNMGPETKGYLEKIALL